MSLLESQYYTAWFDEENNQIIIEHNEPWGASIRDENVCVLPVEGKNIDPVQVVKIMNMTLNIINPHMKEIKQFYGI